MAEPDRQAAARMRAAFETLPHWPREVFYLHRVERLDHPAIAMRLGIDVAAVEANLAEALLRVDRSLREAETGEHPGEETGREGDG